MLGSEVFMSEDRHRDWVDTTSRLLIPVVIFIAGFVFSYQKDKNDRANQQFERESGILRLVASSNEKEKDLGLRIVEVLQKQGKFSPDLLPVVQVISQGRPGDTSTQAAQGILATAAKQDSAIGKQLASTPVTRSPTVYIQIAREDQRAEAGDLRANLEAAGFVVPGIELISRGTFNTYVRYFSANDKALAEKIFGLMKNMGFDAKEQALSATSNGNVPPGQIEVWIGDKQGPLTTQ
jgi:hypothetical protein